MDARGLARTIASVLTKHSPAILTGLGVAGFATTVVMTAKAAPKVRDIHIWEEGFREVNCDSKDDVRDSYVAEAKSLAPLVIPPAIVGVASVGCFIFSNKVQADRQAAIMAAYSLSTETLARYQEKVIEKLGEDEHSHILDEATRELAADKVPDGYKAETEIVPMGKVRVYDTVTGRYFYSTKEAIYEAESEINQMLVDQAMVLHEEFYYLLGLEEQYAMGSVMGWDISNNHGARALKTWVSPHLDDEKNPCLALHYHVAIFDRDA